jgi:hypothetical protein
MQCQMLAVILEMKHADTQTVEDDLTYAIAFTLTALCSSNGDRFSSVDFQKLNQFH